MRRDRGRLRDSANVWSGLAGQNVRTQQQQWVLQAGDTEAPPVSRSRGRFEA